MSSQSDVTSSVIDSKNFKRLLKFFLRLAHLDFLSSSSLQDSSLTEVFNSFINACKLLRIKLPFLTCKWTVDKVFIWFRGKVTRKLRNGPMYFCNFYIFIRKMSHLRKITLENCIFFFKNYIFHKFFPSTFTSINVIFYECKFKFHFNVIITYENQTMI